MQVLHLVASAQRRGAELFAVELARALGERGYPGRVVAMAGAKTGAAIPSVDVLNEPYSPSGLRRLRRLARGADVVIGHGSRALVGGTMATLGTSVPFVYRSIGDPAMWGASSPLRRLRVGLQLRRAAAVVALWPGAATTIERSFGVLPSRVRTIASATAAERFRQRTAQDRSAARGELGIGGTRLVAAIVGSLSVEKRPELAIEGALRAGATVLVAGDGPLRAALVRRWPGEDVHFLGVLDDVRPVLDAADVVVLSSSTEGFPGVLREAALTGLPLVATDVGGVNLIVDESTGRLVPADVTVDQLAAAISTAAADGDRLGTTARLRVLERFTIEPIADQWADLLGDVTDS